MSRNFVIGDIHGGHKALLQCLERCGFDYEGDRLIVLGDVADGWPETPEVIEELLKIKHLVPIMGNHDQWAFDWLEHGDTPLNWTEQGGQATLDAYVQRHGDLMVKHREEYFKKCLYYYVDEEDKAYIHGGIPQDIPIKSLSSYLKGDLMWDRSLAIAVLTRRLKTDRFQGKDFKEIYLGHTTTTKFSNAPVGRGGKVILLDTGGGWEGKVSIMDTDTKHFWQSDMVAGLYPEHRGRN